MLCCTICNDWYPCLGRDRSEICPDCFLANFSGAQPPLDLPAPLAREALEAYVDAAGTYTLTPRQRVAMARLQAAWRRQAGEGEA